MFRIIVLLLIAFVCGSIGSALAGASRKGCITTIALGFVGALVGGWLSRELDVPELINIQGLPVVWSIIGAAVFVAVITLISGGNSDKGSKKH